MVSPEQRQNWRQRTGWLFGQLAVIFVGVSAAFVVENYRQNQNELLPRISTGW